MGAASIPPDIPIRAREVLGDNLLIFNGYGATETTSAMATNVGDEYAAHPSSVGKLNPTADLRIVADGCDLGINELGELWFRSHRSPTATGTTRGHRRIVCRRLVAHRRRRLRRRRRFHLRRRPHQGRHHPRRRERVLRRNPNRSCSPIPTSSTSPRSVSPTSRWANRSAPSSSPTRPPTHPRRPPRLRRRPPRLLQTPRIRAPRRRRPRTATGKIAKRQLRDELRTDTLHT